MLRIAENQIIDKNAGRFTADHAPQGGKMQFIRRPHAQLTATKTQHSRQKPRSPASRPKRFPWSSIVRCVTKRALGGQIRTQRPTEFENRTTAIAVNPLKNPQSSW